MRFPRILAVVWAVLSLALVTGCTSEVAGPDLTPVAHAGPDRTAAVGAAVSLDGSASFDPDGDSLSYQWVILAAPVGSTAGITDGQNRIARLTPDVPGVWLIRLVVRDANNISEPDVMRIQASVEGCQDESECDDLVDCTDDTCNTSTGLCEFVPNDQNCQDDGLFCNGTESCDLQDGCVSSGNPCAAQSLVCDEDADACVTCQEDADCADSVDCTDDSCNVATGECEFSANDSNCPDDGLFCNGGEVCDPLDGCMGSGDPCASGGQLCDDSGDRCVDCLGAGDCDDSVDCTSDSCDPTDGSCQHAPNDVLCPGDGQFCNGAEVCDAQDGCVSPGDPCAATGAPCDEANDLCLECGDGVVSNSLGEDCDPGLPQTDNCCDPADCTFVASGDSDPQSVCSGAPECQLDVCDGLGGCMAVNAPDGTNCTQDALFCNGPEECQSGACVSPGNPCVIPGDCDENNDICAGCGDGVVSAVEDCDPAIGGTNCCNPGTCLWTDDGDPDPQSVCSGAPVCQQDVCNGSGGCTFGNLQNGSPCDDGQYCTGTDSCQGGSCTGGAGPDCSAFTDQCNLGACDEAGDSCYADPANEGGACNDGQFCTTGETCTAGSCGGGGATDCSAFADQCNNAACDEAGDSCYADPTNEGVACNDGQFCTTAENCTAGVCGGGGSTDCSAFTNTCSNGACDEAGDTCYGQPANEGGACNDGQFCTTGETCTAGSCAGGGATDCSAFTDQCNNGACDEAGDTCYADPANEGVACNDGQFCTSGDSCTAGSCGGPATDCSAFDDDCNNGACDEVGDTCYPDPTNEGGACEDGQFCTSGENCTAGVCGGGGPTDCSGLDDDCNDGACDEAGDTCYPDPTNEGGGCDDGQFCTNGETCSAGVCGGGGATDCSGFTDQCNNGDCDETGDTCYADPTNEGGACDDTLFCTLTDTCQSGTCVGAGDPCPGPDGDDDCVESCNELGGNCSLPDPDDSLCDDGLYCTLTDTCQFGGCSGADSPCVNPGDCDEGNDNCGSCIPDEKWCGVDGRTLHTCASDGSGPDPAQEVVCGFVCEVDTCLYASNVSDAEMGACDDGDPPLTPADGDTLTFTQAGITCSSDCGDGSTLIPALPGPAPTDPLRVCVSDLHIPASVTMVSDGVVTNGLIILAANDALVEGLIVFDGQDGAHGMAAGLPGGPGGPGGSSGANGCAAHSCTGLTGNGTGGGGGGVRGSGAEGGAGGGAGFGGTGGNGGMGGDGAGGAGGPTYPGGPPWLIPLAGGSGGGSGADGLGGSGSGPGGGGGGALQFTARYILQIDGAITSNGGAGGEPDGNHGSGGGGSGGGILLEARAVLLGGTITVEGGHGGANATSGDPGGLGASGPVIDGGPGVAGSGAGGTGGGGGGGRVEFYYLIGSGCSGVSPVDSCSQGSLGK